MKKILIFVFILISCHKSDTPDFSFQRTYTIKEGHHYAEGINWREKFTGIITMHFSITPESCYYDLGQPDNEDINKFFGISWGLLPNPEKNSFRIGWNCYKQNGKLQWFYYIHNWKTRIPSPDDPYDKTLLFESSDGKEQIFDVYFNYTGSIQITSTGMPGDTVIVPFSFEGANLEAWYLNPYFGGNKKAPHDMKITIKR